MFNLSKIISIFFIVIFLNVSCSGDVRAANKYSGYVDGWVKCGSSPVPNLEMEIQVTAINNYTSRLNSTISSSPFRISGQSYPFDRGNVTTYTTNTNGYFKLEASTYDSVFPYIDFNSNAKVNIINNVGTSLSSSSVSIGFIKVPYRNLFINYCPPTPTPIPTATSVPPTSTPIPLLPPQNFSGTCSSSGQVSLIWSPASFATYYSIRVDGNYSSFDGTKCNPSGDSNDICSDTGNQTSYSFAGKAGMSYQAWIHSRNTSGVWSSAVYTTFLCPAPTSTPTKAPTSTPTKAPTFTPTKAPTFTPTKIPTPTVTPYPAAVCANVGQTFWSLLSYKCCTPNSMTTFSCSYYGTCYQCVASSPPPPPPTLIPTPILTVPPSPSTLSGTCVNGTVNLSWIPVSGVNIYALRVNDISNGWNGSCNPANLSGDICIDSVSVPYYSFSGVPGNSYDWWVHSLNGAGASGASTGLRINCPVAVVPTSIPVLTAPTAVSVSKSILCPTSNLSYAGTISWSGGKNASVYLIRVWDTAKPFACGQGVDCTLSSILGTGSMNYNFKSGINYSVWVEAWNSTWTSYVSSPSVAVSCPYIAATSTSIPVLPTSTPVPTATPIPATATPLPTATPAPRLATCISPSQTSGSYVWNNSQFTQSWNGSSWIPASSPVAQYVNGGVSSCSYKCSTGYSWSGTTTGSGSCMRNPTGVTITGITSNSAQENPLLVTWSLPSAYSVFSVYLLGTVSYSSDGVNYTNATSCTPTLASSSPSCILTLPSGSTYSIKVTLTDQRSICGSGTIQCVPQIITLVNGVSIVTKPWFQIDDGSIHVNSNSSSTNDVIVNQIPVTCSTINGCENSLYSSKGSGFLTRQDGKINLGRAITGGDNRVDTINSSNVISSKKVSHNTLSTSDDGTVRFNYDYGYWDSKFDSSYMEPYLSNLGTKPNLINSPRIGIGIFKTNGTGTEDISIGGTEWSGLNKVGGTKAEKIVIVHNGNLIINGDIEVANNGSVLMLVASGDIKVAASVKNLQGVFFSKDFYTGSKSSTWASGWQGCGSNGDPQLNFQGTLIAYNKINLERVLSCKDGIAGTPSSSTKPAETFTYRPDMIEALRGIREIQIFDYKIYEVAP